MNADGGSPKSKRLWRLRHAVPPGTLTLDEAIGKEKVGRLRVDSCHTAREHPFRPGSVPRRPRNMPNHISRRGRTDLSCAGPCAIAGHETLWNDWRYRSPPLLLYLSAWQMLYLACDVSKELRNGGAYCHPHQAL